MTEHTFLLMPGNLVKKWNKGIHGLNFNGFTENGKAKPNRDKSDWIDRFFF